MRATDAPHSVEDSELLAKLLTGIEADADAFDDPKIGRAHV